MPRCGTKHKIEATNQIPHPSGVVIQMPHRKYIAVRQIPTSPGKGEGQMPGVCVCVCVCVWGGGGGGGLDVRVSN